MANGSAKTIEIKNDANLGLAILIAEDEEGNYEPIGAAVSINEAREIAQSNLRAKRRRLERDEHPGLCPFAYKIWAQGPRWHVQPGEGVRRHLAVAR
jgi:hypothetical protein